MIISKLNGVCAVLTVLAASIASAEQIDRKAQIDVLVEPLLKSETVVGMVVGIVEGDGTAAWGYGKLSPSSDQTPDDRTLFEIGSVTKTITALALAAMVEEKKLSLDDPLAKWLPEGVQVPDRDGRRITLVDLATHTSGLPRLPGHFWKQAADTPQNPYANCTPEFLFDGLAETKLDAVPGEKFSYSNLGAGLLGEALRRCDGRSYEEMICSRICRPLGMDATRITLDDEARKRFSPGHDGDGNPLPAWDMAALAGAGGVRSNARDMLRYVAAQLEPQRTPLAAAIEATHVGRHTVAKDRLDIALAWHVWTKEQIHWHNGQTGGYHSFVGFNKARKTGVVILSNTAGGTIDELARQIFRLLAGEKVEPMKLKVPAQVSTETLDRYVGAYTLLPTFSLTITREGHRLYAQGTSQPRLRIYPESETEFTYRSVNARITFEKEADGSVKKLILHQNGVQLPGWKGGLVSQLGKRLLDAASKLEEKPDGSKDSPPPAPR